MKLTFDIPEKDLVEFGKETIQQEIHKMLKWLKIKQSFKKISESLQRIDEGSYYQELDKIRETTWDEYKKDLKL
ncbi:MAG: hypothetical protein SCK70_09335 [bacterium]|nr:hypothetical protein [bacterium]